MSTLEDLRPGDIMFANHVRPWAADALIWAGQGALGQGRYPHHVGVVVESAYESRAPRMVQAMPSGAEEVELGPDFWTPDYVYIRPRYGLPNRLLGLERLSEVSQAFLVARAARSYVGTPYSFLDYLAIAGVHLGIKNGPIRRRVTSSKHMICSQLADQALTDAGYHVFDDGRLPQDVTPGALFTRLMDLGPALVIIPE